MHFTRETFRLYREYMKEPLSFGGVATKLDKRANRLGRQKYLFKIRMMMVLQLLSQYPKLFADFHGLCWTIDAPTSVVSTLRRYLDRLVKVGHLEKHKLSFETSQGPSPEITKLAREGLLVIRDFFLLSSGTRKPRPRYVYRLQSARLALSAQNESVESSQIRELWTLLDQTGQARRFTNEFSKFLDDLGRMKNLKSLLTSWLEENARVHKSLLKLMVKCGIKQETVVKKLIDSLDSNLETMLQHINDGVSKIKRPKLVEQLGKRLPDTLGLDPETLVRSEPLLFSIEGKHFLDCSLCGYDNLLSPPLPREITCQYCNAVYRLQEPRSTQEVEEKKARSEQVEVAKSEETLSACTECGDKNLWYDPEASETVCTKCAIVQSRSYRGVH